MEPLKVEKVLLITHSRADSYKILSQCYFLPDENLFNNLKNLDALSGNPCLELIQYILTSDALELLRVDFSRLFVGPFKLPAPPYGSVYLDGGGRIMGDSTIAVRKQYQEEGLEISLKEVPDHIAIELEFMYYLIVKEMGTLKSGNNEAAADCEEKQLFFLSEYLGSWVPQFAGAVEKGARTEFYRALARATQSFVQSDLRALESKTH